MLYWDAFSYVFFIKYLLNGLLIRSIDVFLIERFVVAICFWCSFSPLCDKNDMQDFLKTVSPADAGLLYKRVYVCAHHELSEYELLHRLETAGPADFRPEIDWMCQDI
jgi:hypothetical protein